MTEAQPRAISGLNLFSSAHKTLLQADVQSLRAVGSNGKTRKDPKRWSVLQARSRKNAVNLHLDIYDLQEVMNILEKPNLQAD